MRYRVHEGCTVLWPDGSVRAKAGEVFEGHDSDGTKRSIEFASAILASHRAHIWPTTDAETTGDMPSPLVTVFEDLADAPADPAPAPRKKASRKKLAAAPPAIAPDEPDPNSD